MPPKGLSWADMVRGKGSIKGNAAKGGAKGSTESLPSTPEMGPNKREAPSNDLTRDQLAHGSLGSSRAGSETAMHRPELEAADATENMRFFKATHCKEPGPRKGGKGSSKGKQPANPGQEVQGPKGQGKSGKGSPRSSPEEQEEKETWAQEPEPVQAQSGEEESQPSSKAATPRRSMGDMGVLVPAVRGVQKCRRSKSRCLQSRRSRQSLQSLQSWQMNQRKSFCLPHLSALLATILTGWAKLFEGGPGAAGNKGTSKGNQPADPGREVPGWIEAASALGGGCKPVHPFESQPSSKAATDSSSASSSGPPEPAQEEQGKTDTSGSPAAKKAAMASEGNEIPRLTKAANAGLSLEDGDGSEDFSNEEPEFDTFDYRTYYMMDLRNRDSDTEPTIYGSDSESSDEGF